MEQQCAFEGAAQYTADSIERCQQLTQFIKKRLAIEEEYARSLRKLCKSVSLTPLQQPKGFWFWGGGRKVDSGVPNEDICKTSLWGTFYEIVDDTAQVAKSHTAFAESLQHQLFEPLTASILEMQTNRRQLVEQGTQLTKNIQEAAISLKKARKQFDQSNKDLSKQRAALEKLQAQRQLTEGGDLGKIQAKMRAAEERFTGSRQTFRLQEEALKSLQAKLYTQELPRIMSRLQQQEVQRSRESLSYILGLIELERRCAVMNENYANDMALKLKHINLVEDERRFTRTYMSIPIAPPPPPPPPSLTIAIAEPSQPAMRTMGEIPRTVSMPPAYESQQQSMPILQRHATGSAILGMVVTSEEAHSRYPTAIMMGEGEPSQPATMISQC